MIPGVTGPLTGVKVLVATKPVDFRKGMDGLHRAQCTLFRSLKS